MKRVLLTGIGGAIGVHLMAHILTETDWDIVGIDSFRHKGDFDRITCFCRDHPDWPPRVRIITHDLTAPLTARETGGLGRIDYILNLASLSDVAASIADPVPFVRNNTELMLTVLELARAVQPTTFLHFSTDEVYGPAERDGAGHPEWDAIVPSNAYAASKAAQEALCIAWWRSYGVPLVITNTMNNFAETQGKAKYPAMIQRHVEAGTPVTVHVSGDGQIGTRYYLHSRNAADAVLFILASPPHRHEPGELDRPDRYNIVGDKQVDNLALAVTIAELMGKPLLTKAQNWHVDQPGHDLHYGLDGSKLASLGWRAPRTFEESMKATIEWQRAHPEWTR